MADIQQSIWFGLGAVALPLCAFLVLWVLPETKRGLAHLMIGFSNIGGLFLAFSVSIWAWQSPEHLGLPAVQLPWLGQAFPQLAVSVGLDRVSATLLLVVALISGLVQWFSTAYMRHDPHYVRYFSYLALFTASMQGLLVVRHLGAMYVFWELVGLSSYLLIGFWREKPAAAKAAGKAFLMNRIGDMGFLMAILAAYSLFGTLDLSQMWEQGLGAVAVQQPFWVNVMGLGLLLGAAGKSAQFPLSTWLPDAMEGPTPVSALLHAATMVAAGVYLLVRTAFLMTPFVLLATALVGAITAFWAAFSALSQTDIKKVLAYSTVSQLGFMVAAVGMGGPEAASFHLLTHAFFKAGLFLAAGAVLHHLHEAFHDSPQLDTQDMRLMGGLRQDLPLVALCFALFGLALAGFPLTAGFLSKDLILAYSLKTVELPHYAAFYAVPVLLFGASLLTAFYVGRQYWLVFEGKPRVARAHIPHLPKRMQAILLILAAGSLAFVYAWPPFSPEKAWWLGEVTTGELPNRWQSWVSAGLSVVLAVVGLGLAIRKYRKQVDAATILSKNGGENRDNWDWFRRISQQAFYLDAFYESFAKAAGRKLTTMLMRFDRIWLDAPILQTGVWVVVSGFIMAWVDRVLVDGLVGGMSRSVSSGGWLVTKWQENNVQIYIFLALLGSLTILFFWVF